MATALRATPNRSLGAEALGAIGTLKKEKSEENRGAWNRPEAHPL
jgi:hypothetical protein